MKAIIYYSLSGRTKRAVEERFEGDFFRLKGKIKIPRNYAIQMFYLGFYATFDRKLDYHNIDIDLSKYDSIVLASPVWAFTFVPFMKKFLLDVKLRNKKIELLITHEGGPGKTLKKMRNYLHSSNEIIEEYSIKTGGKYEKNDK